MKLTKENLQAIVDGPKLDERLLAEFWRQAGGRLDGDVLSIDTEGVLLFTVSVVGVAVAKPMLNLMLAEEKLAAMAEMQCKVAELEKEVEELSMELRVLGEYDE